LQRNRVGSDGGLEFDIAIGACIGTVAKVAEMPEPSMGTKSGMDTKFGLSTGSDMCTGLIRGVGMGIGMLELLW
jgi:hypothetical protein